MGKIWIPGGGGGGADLDVVTAAADDVLSGKVIVGPDGEPLTGTLALSGTAGAGHVLSGQTFYNTNAKSKQTGSMTNRGAWTGTCGTNGSVTIPAGYHNGSGKVTNSQATMAGKTITPQSSAQTVACNGKLMTGNIVVNGANLYKCVSGSVNAATSRRNFTAGGNTVSLYYFTVNLSGFKSIGGVSWIGGFGGHAVNGGQFNIVGSSYSNYYTAGGVVNTNQIILPSGVSSGEKVYYWVYGIAA